VGNQKLPKDFLRRAQRRPHHTGKKKKTSPGRVKTSIRKACPPEGGGGDPLMQSEKVADNKALQGVGLASSWGKKTRIPPATPLSIRSLLGRRKNRAKASRRKKKKSHEKFLEKGGTGRGKNLTSSGRLSKGGGGRVRREGEGQGKGVQKIPFRRRGWENSQWGGAIARVKFSSHQGEGEHVRGRKSPGPEGNFSTEKRENPHQQACML